MESGYNLTLANFAHLMTIQYPAKKRIEIFDKICKSSDLAYCNNEKWQKYNKNKVRDLYLFSSKQ